MAQFKNQKKLKMNPNPSHLPRLPREIWLMILEERSRLMERMVMKERFWRVMWEVREFYSALVFGFGESYSHVNDEYVAQKVEEHRELVMTSLWHNRF